MKKTLSILIFSLFCKFTFAQNAKTIDSPSGTVISNAGGTDIPYSSSILDIRSNNKAVLLPRMTTTNRDAITSPIAGMLLYNNTTNQFNFHDGISWQQAFFGNQWNINGSSISYSGGNVGIGTTSPDYPLTVIGDTRISGRLAINDPIPSYNLDVNGNASIDNLGVGIAPDPAYPLKATGITNLSGLLVTSTANLNSTVNIAGTLNANGNLAVNGSAAIDGTITVENGKGIVRSNTATQQKIVRMSAGFSLTSVGVGGFADGTLNYENFGGVPTVTVGQVENGTGDWNKVLVVPFNATATGCSLRFTNVGSDTNTMTGTWHFTIIGTK